MANSLLPLAERNLTPDEVAALDRRREWGFTLQIIAGQFLVIATLLTLWIGQDLTYAPAWLHPIAYYFVVAAGIATVCGGLGTWMRFGGPTIQP